MQKLNVAAVLGGLKQTLTTRLLFAPAQQVWLFLVIACDIGLMLLDPSRETALGLLAIFINILLLPVVVNTHRFLLAGEEPSQGARYSPRYLLASLGIYVPLVLGTVLAMFVITIVSGPIPTSDAAPPNVLFGILTFVGFVIFLVVLFRIIWPMSLVLPARALGRNDYSYRDGLTAAEGNIWRLVLLTLVLVLLVFAIAFGGAFIIAAIQAATQTIGLALLGNLIAGALVGVMDYLGAIMGAAILSFAYAGLVERDARYLEASK